MAPNFVLMTIPQEHSHEENAKTQRTPHILLVDKQLIK